MHARAITVFTALIAVSAGLAGCLSDDAPSDLPILDGDGELEAAPGFEAPVQLPGSGFEPSIEVGPEGTVYITAPLAAENDSRSASWLWVSRDGGQTWEAPAEHPVGPPPGYQGFMEGDLAVDPRGWLYQLDTYGDDTTLAAWSDQGRALEHSRAAQGTATFDDRPWVVAVGDGELVYLGNHRAATGPEGVYRTPRQWVYRSVDAGQTWAPVEGVPVDSAGNGFASLAADAASDRVVIPQLTDDEVRVMVSEDGGQTFSDIRPVAEAEGSFGPQRWPSAAVSGEAVYVVWNELTSVNGLAASQLRLAWSTDGGETWEVATLAGGERAFAYPSISLGPSGELGLSVYEAQLPRGGGTNWSISAAVDSSSAGGVDFDLTRADPEPVVHARSADEPLGDFHQNSFGPDGRFHIAYTATHGEERWIRWVATEAKSPASLAADPTSQPRHPDT